eukprot:TRINITY_DN36880_c0_g1_i1.p1 TRINITY_DN36880_c0_g1~~TRINITY_DN36880_c0_g1_i1.p1  ORF type:complete len:385 (+),score=53.76 TRINITY_DN36880_c0_g1_i1:60-1157(+)
MTGPSSEEMAVEKIMRNDAKQGPDRFPELLMAGWRADTKLLSDAALTAAVCDMRFVPHDLKLFDHVTGGPRQEMGAKGTIDSDATKKQILGLKEGPFVLCNQGGISAVHVARHLVPIMPVPFVMVTTYSAGNAGPGIFKEFPPPNLISWYTWNKVSNAEKIVGLPMGLSWHHHVEAVEQARQEVFKNGTVFPTKNGRALVCLSDYRETERMERLKILKMAKESWGHFADVYPYRLMVRNYFRKNELGRESTRPSFYHLLARYSFVIVGFGPGSDTNLIWEALYFGVIPILCRGARGDYVSTFRSTYAKLPVIEVDGWENLSDPGLTTTILSNKSVVENLDFSRLSLDYWVSRIRDEAGDKPEHAR